MADSKVISVDLDVSKLWISKFDDVFQDILEHKHTHYIFPGGRGSTKSPPLHPQGRGRNRRPPRRQGDLLPPRLSVHQEDARMLEVAWMNAHFF